MAKTFYRSAFTIVELIVVISVIGILAGIVLVSYGSWRNSIAADSVKSDLVQAASALETARTFNNTYPLTIPSTFTASEGNTIILTSPGTTSFCLDGTTSVASSITYYIDDLTKRDGATQGTCATRTSLPTPSSVSSVTFTPVSTQININWTLASPNYATQYVVQCSLDEVFITGLLQMTVNSGTQTSATLSGASSSSTYFCRVRAVNANGQSGWSNGIEQP